MTVFAIKTVKQEYFFPLASYECVPACLPGSYSDIIWKRYLFRPLSGCVCVCRYKICMDIKCLCLLRRLETTLLTEQS